MSMPILAIGKISKTLMNDNYMKDRWIPKILHSFRITVNMCKCKRHVDEMGVKYNRDQMVAVQSQENGTDKTSNGMNCKQDHQNGDRKY